MIKNMVRPNASFSCLYAFLASFIIVLAAQNEFVFSSYLHFDDAIFLPQAIFQELTIPSTHPGIFWALALALPVFPVWAIKVLALSFVGILASAICVLLMTRRIEAYTSIIAGVAIATFPVATDQGFFVTGSHPMIGTALLVAAIAVICLAVDKSFAVAVTGMSAAVLLTILSRLVSPSLFLAAIAPLLVLLLSVQHQHIELKRLIPYVLIGCASIIFTLVYGIDYHYSTLVGWTSFEPSQVAGNLVRGALVTLRPLSNPFGIAAVAAIVAVMVVGLRATNRGYMDLRLAFSMLILSALTFGPSAVTTDYLARYAVAPSTFFSIGVCVILLPFLEGVQSRLKWLTALCASILILSVTYWSYVERHKRYGKMLAAHRVTEQIVDATSNYWPANAQVLIALSLPLVSGTAGFNHWSTWYLRYLAKRKDVIGLVGDVGRLNARPFVSKYMDHGPDYWEVRRGRSTRIPMRGLERNRPLLAFVTGPRPQPGSICPSPVQFTRIVPPGMAPDGSGKEVSTGCLAAPLGWPTTD